MESFFESVRACPLFEHIEDKDLAAMLGCLGAKQVTYKKGETIFAEGSPADSLGIVISGYAQIARTDYFGNRSILTYIAPSQIFGESFACAGAAALPVDVVAGEDTAVLIINARRVTESCCNACAFHNQMIFNLLNIVAKKNLVFNQKIEVTSKRSTREKLMTYLLIQAKNHGSSTFTVPFDRQEFADYLEVERSGLSAEISKMRKEKILDCKRSTFTLHTDRT